MCELIIFGKVIKLIPMIINGVHLSHVGAKELFTQLKVVGRVGKYQIHRVLRQGCKSLDAIAVNNGVEGQVFHK